MKALLDTHVFLWWAVDDPALSPVAREWIAMGRNECFVSAASAWEISIKHSRGSLELPDKPEVYFPDRLSRFGFKPLAVQIHHALRVSSLPAHHKDPFDRLLVAQCQVEGIPLITADTQIRMYDAEVIW